MAVVPQVSAIAVVGLPEFVMGDDVGAMIVEQCGLNGTVLADGGTLGAKSSLSQSGR